MPPQPPLSPIRRPDMPYAISLYARGPLSWPIRAAQGFGPFGHVASVLADGTTVEALALHGGVVPRTLRQVLDTSTYVEAWGLPATADQIAQRDAFLAGRIGRPYDWIGAAGAAWLGVRQWQSGQADFCSELDCLSLMHPGLLRVSEYIRGVTPMRLHGLMVAAGAVRLRPTPLRWNEAVPL